MSARVIGDFHLYHLAFEEPRAFFYRRGHIGAAGLLLFLPCFPMVCIRNGGSKTRVQRIFFSGLDAVSRDNDSDNNRRRTMEAAGLAGLAPKFHFGSRHYRHRGRAPRMV